MAERARGRLASALGRLDAPADSQVLAEAGWLVGVAADDPLPLAVMGRLVIAGMGHVAASAMARWLLMRSARCRRSGPAYLDRARSVLQMLRQQFAQQADYALWLGLAYLAAGRFSEAWRELQAACRLDPESGTALAAATVADLVLGRRPGLPGGREVPVGVAQQLDPGLVELARVLQVTRRAAPKEVRLEVMRYPDQRLSDQAEQPAVAVWVDAVSGGPVRLRGAWGERALGALEGELLLALLSLAAAEPSQGVARQKLWSAVWPVAPLAVGRLEGLFSLALRRVRRATQQVAGRPVVEHTHRGGYRVAEGIAVSVRMDLPALAANWILARSPARTWG
ncbi:hypothetical protein U7230_04465 [Carboxydochorda subterranea]|uniref:Transcriptional regulator n=1 Tax=Carboxydichorda subterranea TaxID=3109565 RepID=A0ABZ1BZL1_9FIRM|nr:hypothetical protein [Limnochorda sp. L945t]WRP18266.1 hypothetical protein U7230_04465 [Limnochorda sp. L945t]